MTQDQGLHHTEYDSRLAAYAVVLDEHQDRRAAAGSDRRILLALWNEADQPLWTLPGGGVELWESPEEAAVREVREETGYDVALRRLVGVDTIVVPPEARTVDRDRWFRGIRVVYRAAVVGGELRHEVDGTTDEARWFPLDRVGDLPRVELVDVGLRLLAAASG